MFRTVLAVATLFSQYHHVFAVKDGWCVPIATAEPAECPDHIGPPCPRCYNNTMPDYQAGDRIDVKSIEADLKRQIMNFTSIILRDAPPNQNTTDVSISNGLMGRAYLFMRLAEYEADATQKTTWLKYAKQYLAAAENKFPNPPMYPSFLVGNVGGYAIAAIMADKDGNNAAVEKYVNLIEQQFDDASPVNAKIDKEACIYFAGQAGLVMTGLFVNNYFQAERISRDKLFHIIERIINVGVKYSNGNGLRWNGVPFSEPTCFLNGMAEGMGGILDTILKAANSWVPQILQNQTIVDLLIKSTDYLMDIQYEDGNMPTPVCRGTTPGDIEVQWCHGAPGFVSYFGNAYRTFKTIAPEKAIEYLAAAYKASDSVWNRGLLTKGMLFCHGVGGNAYMFLDLYRYTNDYKQAWRAFQFVKWSLNPAHVAKVRKGDTPNAMYEGQHGVVMLYAELNKKNWPVGRDFCMPGWTPCF